MPIGDGPERLFGGRASAAAGAKSGEGISAGGE
jgi:hypothetical protein